MLILRGLFFTGAGEEDRTPIFGIMDHIECLQALKNQWFKTTCPLCTYVSLSARDKNVTTMFLSPNSPQ